MRKIFRTVFLLQSLFFGFLNPCLAAVEEVTEFDLRYYHQENYGLKDLVFEVRVSNLLENLNKRMTFGHLDDVYFKVYWMFPGQYRVVLNGFPKGFKEVRLQLKQMVKSRLDLVIAERMSAKIRSYKLKKKVISGNVIIEGVDRTGASAISQIKLEFRKNGQLISFKSFSPTGVNSSVFKLGVRPWSHNKWVVSQIDTKLIQGMEITKITTSIEYLSVKGFGFPEKVNITTDQESFLGKKNGKKNIRSVDSSIEFSKYEVNTGKASRYILKGIES